MHEHQKMRTVFQNCSCVSATLVVVIIKRGQHRQARESGESTPPKMVSQVAEPRGIILRLGTG